tara:strand:+ start:277 stop:1641 length:1365 start_codon:yes stop_codon:yes gene_type:complete
MATSAIDNTSVLSLADYDTVLKEIYLGPVREQLNSETILSSRIARNEQNVEGRKVIVPLHTGRSFGFGAVQEGGILPYPQEQQFTTIEFYVKYLYARVHIGGVVIAATKGDVGSFVRAIDSEVSGVMRDFKHDMNRMYFNDGSGILGYANQTGGDSDETFTVRQWGDCAEVGSRLKYFAPGRYVGGISLANNMGTGSTPYGGVSQISAVDINARQITIDSMDASVEFFVHAKGPGTTAVEHTDAGVAIGQAGVETSWGNECQGLLGLVVGSPTGTQDTWAHSTNGHVLGSAGTEAALYAVTDSLWQSQIIANGNVPQNLSEDLMQQALDLTEEFGTGETSLILTTYGVRQAFYDLLAADKRYPNTTKLTGGYTALDYNGHPFVVDKDCTAGTMYFLDESTFQMFRMQDFTWLDDDGSIWHRREDTHDWQATLAYFGDFGVTRRNANAAILDIQE